VVKATTPLEVTYQKRSLYAVDLFENACMNSSLLPATFSEEDEQIHRACLHVQASIYAGKNPFGQLVQLTTCGIAPFQSISRNESGGY